MADSATVRELGPIFCFWLIPGFLQADETVFVVVVDLLLYCVFSCDGDTLPWVSSSPAKRPVEAACHRTHPSPFSVNFCCKHCFFCFFVPFQGLIVDQTIEKVSFCAPDRNHEKGFSYICRDGTTRRWMCHGFLATKDSVRSFSLSRLFLFLFRNRWRQQTEVEIVRIMPVSFAWSIRFYNKCNWTWIRERNIDLPLFRFIWLDLKLSDLIDLVLLPSH